MSLYNQQHPKTKDLYITVIYKLHMSQNNYNLKIIEALLRSENHIRGLAKLLGTNQTTIARKVRELHKENILDWKREGRNKVVFLKKSLETKQYVYAVEVQKLLVTIKK